MKYTIHIVDQALKELSRIPDRDAKRVDEAILHLESVPRPYGCVKLTSSADRWRVRVGDYRILYIINDEKAHVDVCRILNRKEAYKKR